MLLDHTTTVKHPKKWSNNHSNSSKKMNYSVWLLMASFDKNANKKVNDSPSRIRTTTTTTTTTIELSWQLKKSITQYINSTSSLITATLITQLQSKNRDCFFKKLLFTMKNAATAGSSQSSISRLYIWKNKKSIT